TERPWDLRAAEDLPKLPDLVPLERLDRLRLLRRVVRGVVRLEPALAVILDPGRVQAPFLRGDAGGNEVEVAAVAGERRHGLVQQAGGLLIRLLRVERRDLLLDRFRHELADALLRDAASFPGSTLDVRLLVRPRAVAGLSPLLV